MRHRPETPSEYIKARLRQDVATGCWVWLGSYDGTGYGQYRNANVRQQAHRVSYETFRGAIPEGHHLHHVCENRSCVNPDHLLPTTIREHNADLTPRGFAYKNKRLTHCKNRHALTPDNLSPYWLVRGMRVCVICLRVRERRSYQRNRAKKLAAHRAWRERNRDYCLTRDRERYQARKAQ